MGVSTLQTSSQMNIHSSESTPLHSLLTQMLLPDESTTDILLVEQLQLHVVEAML